MFSLPVASSDYKAEWKSRETRVRDYMEYHAGDAFAYVGISDSEYGIDTLLIYASNVPPRDERLIINVATRHARIESPNESSQWNSLLLHLFGVLNAVDTDSTCPNSLLSLIMKQNATIVELSDSLMQERGKVTALTEKMTKLEHRFMELHDDCSAWIMHQQLEAGYDVDYRKNSSSTTDNKVSSTSVDETILKNIGWEDFLKDNVENNEPDAHESGDEKWDKNSPGLDFTVTRVAKRPRKE